MSSNGEQQPSCRYFPTPFNLFAQQAGLNRLIPDIQLVDSINWNPNVTQNCDWVPGCYYLMRKELISEVGLFDPIYFLYYEEVDHCYAAKKAGWDVTYFADTSVTHIGGESAKSIGKITSSGKQLNQLQAESELIYFRKNNGLLICIIHLLLIILADTLQTIKNLLKLRLIKPLTMTILMLKTAWRTRFGKLATR